MSVYDTKKSLHMVGKNAHSAELEIDVYLQKIAGTNEYDVQIRTSDGGSVAISLEDFREIAEEIAGVRFGVVLPLGLKYDVIDEEFKDMWDIVKVSEAYRKRKTLKECKMMLMVLFERGVLNACRKIMRYANVEVIEK